MRARFVLPVLAMLLVTGCGSQVANDYPAEVLATAGDASGLLLAYGTVVSGDEPVGNANVVLQATPVTSAAENDEGAQRWSTPAVTTDEQGHWELRLDPASIPEEYYPEHYSFLEFDLVFGDGARLAVWRGTVFLRTRPNLWRTEGTGPDDGVLRVDVDLDSGEVTATDSLGEPIVPD